MPASQSEDQSSIYILEAGSAVSASIFMMIQAADYEATLIPTISHFTSHFIERGLVREDSIVIIDLQSADPSNYRLLSFLIESRPCPNLLLLTELNGTFDAGDSVRHGKMRVVNSPITPQDLFTALEGLS